MTRRPSAGTLAFGRVKDNKVTSPSDNPILVDAGGTVPESHLALICTIDIKALKEFGK